MAKIDGIDRFIFTVATGRCGQASLAELVEAFVPGCYDAFEEPNIRPILPRPFDRYERQFRRRFVETHELLGRGRVLTAFEAADRSFIDGIVAKRLRSMRQRMAARGTRIYFDISKFFARGLHVGFTKAVGPHALVNLVRDPLLNMRSFVNRAKDFTLDNNLPNARSNMLRLDSSDMSPGELYLWAWCELYLRFDALRQSNQVTHAIEIRTERLEDADYMNAVFDALDLAHLPVAARPPRNTNTQQGLETTRASADDIRLFERFLGRVPAAARARIDYLKDYDPWAVHNISAVAET